MSVFDLRDVLGDLPHDTMVHECYAPTVDALRAEIRANEHALALYRGITRFPAEDTAAYPGTRSALQRECRQRVYGVIQHSRAWGDLIAEHHPHAVRLSIHTQPIGAPKFGIRLLDAPDAWTTPWHSVARCRTDGTWTLIATSSRSRIPRGGNARAQGPGWGLAGEPSGSRFLRSAPRRLPKWSPEPLRVPTR